MEYSKKSTALWVSLGVIIGLGFGICAGYYYGNSAGFNSGKTAGINEGVVQGRKTLLAEQNAAEAAKLKEIQDAVNPFAAQTDAVNPFKDAYVNPFAE